MGKIKSIRIGHATNSSSSHSVVIVPRGASRAKDYIPNDDYGWQQFTLASVEAKMDYIAVDRYTSYQGDWDSFLRDFGPWVDHERLKAIFSGGSYVDHQSYGTSNGLSLEMARRPEIVILGGNDNDGEHPLSSVYPRFTGRGEPVIRRDGDNEVYYWSNNGLKIRFGEGAYDKAFAPELVDLKLTDYCPYGCFFCYQGSTKQGRHADPKLVFDVIAELGRIKCFEVAFGGGEPVMHPMFGAILRHCADVGVTPNFTTFGVSWLTDEVLVKTIEETVGGIGVSVHDASDLGKVKKIIEKFRNYYSRPRVVAQHVVGTASLDELKKIVDESPYQSEVLLLGYKNVGRGTAPEFRITETNINRILEEQRRYESRSISVDTALLDLYPGLEVDPILATSPEGKFSCYVDAVEGTIAPSSYCDKSLHRPLTDVTSLLDVFKEF